MKTHNWAALAVLVSFGVMLLAVAVALGVRS